MHERDCFLCLLLGSFPSICFVLFDSNEFFVLFYILFYSHPLEACLFSNESQKGGGSGWEGSGEEWKGVERMIIRIHM